VKKTPVSSGFPDGMGQNLISVCKKSKFPIEGLEADVKENPILNFPPAHQSHEVI